MSFIHDHVASRGHSVEYLCADNVSGTARWSRFTFPTRVFRHAMAAAEAGHPYDIVNVHEPSGAVVSLLKGLAGTRVVVTSHGVEQRGWEQQLQDRENAPTLRTRLIYPPSILWQARIALSFADHVFCLNSEDRAYLTDRFGIAEHRVTRIYPAADPVYGEAVQCRDYSNAHNLMFCGTWLKRKGIDDAVSAFAGLADRYPALTLSVLNGGVPDSVVRGCFPESLRNRVTCRNAEPERGNAVALGSADIYLLPSLYEGTPLTLIEAMWSGLPIVTTNTCGMKDVIRDGQTGLLVPMRSPEAIINAVARLVDDRDLRMRLGRAAHHEAVTRYTWRQSAEPVWEVYERISGAAARVSFEDLKRCV